MSPGWVDWNAELLRGDLGDAVRISVDNRLINKANGNRPRNVNHIAYET